MSKTVTTTTTYTVSGDGFGGSPTFNESIANTSGNPPSSLLLAAGFNSIAVPATALGVVIVPPPGSAVPLTLKGITGDTGIPVDPGNSLRLKWTAGQVAAFGIAASGPVTVSLLWM